MLINTVFTILGILKPSEPFLDIGGIVLFRSDLCTSDRTQMVSVTRRTGHERQRGWEVRRGFLSYPINRATSWQANYLGLPLIKFPPSDPGLVIPLHAVPISKRVLAPVMALGRRFPKFAVRALDFRLR